MKGYCEGCGKLIDETEIGIHKCKFVTIYHDGVITRRTENERNVSGQS